MGKTCKTCGGSGYQRIDAPGVQAQGPCETCRPAEAYPDRAPSPAAAPTSPEPRPLTEEEARSFIDTGMTSAVACGVFACVWSADPSLSRARVVDIVRETHCPHGGMNAAEAVCKALVGRLERESSSLRADLARTREALREIETLSDLPDVAMSHRELRDTCDAVRSAARTALRALSPSDTTGDTGANHE